MPSYGVCFEFVFQVLFHGVVVIPVGARGPVGYLFITTVGTLLVLQIQYPTVVRVSTHTVNLLYQVQ